MEKAYALALKMIRQRDRFAGEIREKLSASGTDENTIDLVLSRLCQKKLLKPESELAADFAAKIAEKGYGHGWIVEKLKAVGADEEVIQETLANLPAELDQIKGQAHKLLSADKAKTARKLAARGFSDETIESIVEMLNAD